MSDNTHVTAIKQAARDLAQGNIWGTDTYIETIDHHADALAAELAEATSAHRKTIGVFATLRDLDAWLAANPEPPGAVRESHAVAMFGDVRRMAGPQRGREQA